MAHITVIVFIYRIPNDNTVEKMSQNRRIVRTRTIRIDVHLRNLRQIPSY